ncbi:hypothetical protein LQW54_009007 [Pestalotiopsis sp. IQ-011]
MAPTAIYLPEDTSDKFGTDKLSSMKKMGQEKSHLYDLDIRGSTPEIDLHDLAVQNPFQSLSGSTAFESSGSKSRSSLGLGLGSGSGLSSKKHEFHSSSSIGSLRGSHAGHHHHHHHHKIGGLSGALGSIGMETQRVEFSEELSESEKSQFMATIDAMDQLARQSSSMKSVFGTIELEERQNKLKRENETSRTTILKLTFKLKEAETSIESYEGKLRERDSTISKLQGDLDKNQRDTEELRRKLLESNVALGEAETRNRLFEQERDVERQRALSLEAQLSTLQVAFSALEESNAHLSLQHNTLTRDLDATRGKLASSLKMSDELAHLRRAREEEIRTLKSRVTTLEDKVEDTNEQLDSSIETSNEYQSINVSLKNHNSILEQKVTRLRQAVQDTEQKLQEANREAETANDAVSHLTRDLGTSKKETQAVQAEITRMTERISQKHEELRVANTEKERIMQDHRRESSKTEEHSRKIAALQETLIRVETALKEKTQINYSLSERIGRIERERNDALGKAGSLGAEAKRLEAQLLSLSKQVAEATGKYEGASEQLRESEGRYEEVVEAAREVQESHAELEAQLAELRRLVADTREQKEAAIMARVSADHERDEAMSRYEERGREMQRALEERHEQASRQLHHSNGHTPSSEIHRSLSQGFKTVGHKAKKGKKHVMVGDGLTV